jgi:exopolysaccharide biosynthesis protein
VRPRHFITPLLLALLLAIPHTHAGAQIVRRTVATGVELTQETIAPPTGPLVIDVLRINMKQPGVRVQAELAQDVVLADDPTNGREAVGSLAARHGAVAAVNADFFPYTGDPVNITIRDGELLSESLPHRVALGITSDGQVRFDNLLTVGSLMGSDGVIGGLDGINRIAGKDEIVALTPAFGQRTRAAAGTTMVLLSGANLPVRIGQDQTAVAGDLLQGDPKGAIPSGGVVLVGDGRGADWLRTHITNGGSVRFRFDCISNPLPAGPYRKDLASRAASFRGRAIKSVWTDMRQAVGGGPWLVRDGKPAVDGLAENLDETHFTMARHPRTAAGVTASGDLLLVAVDGRQEGVSRGMSLPELADYMMKLGATQAINLDGGGSTAMAIRGGYVNSPSDGSPRAIASALLVLAPDSANKSVIETRDPVTVIAGARTQLSEGQSRIASGGIDATHLGIWTTLEGKSSISQSGILFATQAGPGTAMLVRDGSTIRVPYVVLPGAPAHLRASIGAVENNPPDRNLLTATVVDGWGNPIPGQTIAIQVTGGQAEKSSATTDAAGRLRVEVVWDVEKGRKATITSGSLRPVTISAK